MGLLHIVIGALIFFGVYPFLALNAPVKTDILVVEGWIPRQAIKVAAREFVEAKYKLAIGVGGPVEGYGDDAKEDETYAYVATRKLVRAGVPRELARAVPARVVDRDRTYACAIAVREWFATQGTRPESFNVVTISVHARRTHLLFRKAFGPDVNIGVIAIPSEHYVADRWWRYSEGVKEVLSESAAYLYARLLFSPDNPGGKRK